MSLLTELGFVVAVGTTKISRLRRFQSWSRSAGLKIRWTRNFATRKLEAMKLFSVVLILAAALFAGCATQSSQPGAEKPPRHAGRVKILMYDSSPRNKSNHFEILDGTLLIQKPFKEIALLTCDGTPNQEQVMTGAIIYRARMMGADAVITLQRNGYQEGIGPFGGGNGRSVYRAKAIVWTEK